MKYLFFCFFIIISSCHCKAQEIVFLEEGREIKLLFSHSSNMKAGETVKFQVKYDVYTEDNLVIESRSKVDGIITSKNTNDEFLVKIVKVHDLHGNEIKVRTSKNGKQHLILKGKQKEYSIYVDEGFWFSY